jgi:hypothetical protein
MELPDMLIETESGSTYKIVRGICVKKDKFGNRVDTLKVWNIKSIPDNIKTAEEVYSLNPSEPEVGKRMFIYGRDSYWLSTKIIAIIPLRKEA